MRFMVLFHYARALLPPAERPKPPREVAIDGRLLVMLLTCGDSE